MRDLFGNPEVDIGDEVIVQGLHVRCTDEQQETWRNKVAKVRAMYPNNHCMKNEILVEDCIYYVTMWERYFDPYFWDVD
jgi:hypothetical protein